MRSNPKLFVNAALAAAMAALIAGCGDDRNESTVMETLDRDDNTVAGADSGMYPDDSAMYPEDPAIGTGSDEIAASDNPNAALDDSMLTIKVESALHSDPDTRDLKVKVQTLEGTVELSGIADTQTQIDSAVATTLEVDGVKYVENKLALKADSPSTGGEAEGEVISAN